MFSELVIVFTGHGMGYLLWDAILFTTLRRMNKTRPFKLGILLEVSGCPEGEALRELTEALSSVTAEGLLDFLDSPPVIRSARFRHHGWGWDTSTTDLS